MKTLAKLPVTIVTGFLGAGKTTLLRHMLDNAEGRRIAVIVNEFGELGIDGEILKQCSIGCSEEEAQGRVFELANGCLCCTVQEEFFPVMRELVARRGDLDQILIETSGLALPKPLVQAFQWPEIRNACTVDAVITVVDSPAVAAGTFAAHPEQVDQQRRQDPNLDHESPLHELFEDQLASADLVILNKADQLDAAKARQDTDRQRQRRNERKPADDGRGDLAQVAAHSAEIEQAAQHNQRQRRGAARQVAHGRFDKPGQAHAEQQRRQGGCRSDNIRIGRDAARQRFEAHAAAAEYFKHNHRQNIVKRHDGGHQKRNRPDVALAAQRRADRRAEDDKVCAADPLNHRAAPFIRLFKARDR